MSSNNFDNNDNHSKLTLAPDLTPSRKHQHRLAVPHPVEPAVKQGITPTFIWRVFCTWWKWVVPVGVVLGGVAGVAVWLLHVPEYRASALIKIESEMPFIAFESGTSNKQSDRYVQTQIELIRGPVVLTKLLGRPEIASMSEIRAEAEPIEYIRKHLAVRQVGQSELYEVSFTSRSNRDATTLANLVVAEYLGVQDREDKLRSNMVIEMLEQERLDRGKRVDRMRERVVELARDLTGKDPFGQGVIMNVSAFSSAGALSQSLAEAEVGLEVAKAELQALRNAPIIAADKAIASGRLEMEIANHPSVRRLEARLLALDDDLTGIKSKRRTKRGDSWENDPEYERLTTLATETRDELRTLKESTRKELVQTRIAERKAEQERMVEDKKQEVISQGKMYQMLATKLKEEEQKLRAGGAQSAELEFAKSELEREQKVFELIAARTLALRTEMRAPARVSRMHPASIPNVPTVPIPFKELLVACVIGLMTPLGLAVLRETLVQRIGNSDHLCSESHLPLLGELTQFPTTRGANASNLLTGQKQKDILVFAESIDSLRTNLMLTEQVGALNEKKIIAICSAVSGEGKTSVATSLGVSIAEATKRPTLIIDADLRSPDVAKYLDVPTEPGLAEVLTGNAKPSDALFRVGKTQAYVMAGGKLQVNPHHILRGSNFESLIAVLQQRFSTILIDTPPVMSASESLLYANSADLVVLCALTDVSRSRQVQAATNRMQATGANVAGFVLSGVPTKSYVYNYGLYDRVEPS